MPMNSNTLGTAITNAIAANIPNPTAAVTGAQLEAVWQAVAMAIVDHITSNALVTGTVTSGAGAGGSVTGTIS
jgi:hypothetical protein